MVKNILMCFYIHYISDALELEKDISYLLDQIKHDTNCIFSELNIIGKQQQNFNLMKFKRQLQQVTSLKTGMGLHYLLDTNLQVHLLC